MPHDITQSQSADDERRSRDLSLREGRPPAEVPGYRAEKFLGAGAYGEVWSAFDRNTGRRVAVKFFAHKRGVDWSLLAREVEKLVFLSTDRYVVQLLEVGWDSDPPYYVMELVESGSLEDLLREHGPLPAAEAVEMFREICTGLSHAHGKGVLHCDLKPANILIDEDHKPRLADFGQSRLSSEQTPALGTLFYMAPEQADLQAVPDARWDVYALGAILHRLLTGELPYRTEAAGENLDSAIDLSDRLARYRKLIANSPLPKGHRNVKGVDRALAEIIERCLAYDPTERFGGVPEISAALDARTSTRQMRPMLALGFALPLIMLLVMSLFGWRGYHRALLETETLAVERAAENSTFAAQLAAEKVAVEIERYFRIAEDEADRTPLKDYFAKILENEALPQLADRNLSDEETLRVQERFLIDSERSDLNAYLERRLRRYDESPKLASLFVLDAQGTQLAAAYEGEERSQSIGRNFAFRAYFHGGAADLPRETRTPAVAPVESTHLSAVFQSTTTKKWKVAVATPLWISEGENDEKVGGLLVATVNLGDFEFFQSTSQISDDRFAVLVDGRSGENTGLILQHPLFHRVLADRGSLPESFREARVPLTKGGVLAASLYEDPLGSQPEGAAYRRPFVAAAAPVRSVNRRRRDEESSGLTVLVQEDYPGVIAPVRQLGMRLVREGLSALAVVVLSTILIWLTVLRWIREPVRRRPAVKPLRTVTTHEASTMRG